MNSGGKAFLVLITFIAMIAIFASGAMNQSDLTPATVVIPGENKTVALPQSSSASQNIIGVTSLDSASAPCGNAYTVKSGDTLSSIARACNLSIEGIMAINPSITNANLIRVGQKLALYLPPAPTTAAQPAAGAQQAAVAANAVTSTPVYRSLVPGGSVGVQITGLPGKKPVVVNFSKQGEPGIKVGEGITDPNGNLNLSIAIPTSAKRDEQWLVIITSPDDAKLRLVSQVITIE